MMRNSIVILTECGEQIGLGHLTRCLSLAQQFQNVGLNVELWVAGDATAQDQLPNTARSIQWYDPSGDTVQKMENAHGVLIDSFLVSPAQIERIRTINSCLAIIDDYYRRRYESGVVIDWTIGAEDFAYPSKVPGVIYLLGSDYCAIRPDFNNAPTRRFPEAPGNVLVTFGGTDLRKLTEPVVTMLQQKFPQLEKNVVLGSGVKDATFIPRLQDSRTTFHFSCSAVQMQTLMVKADLAICGGGQTLYELASQALPPVAIRVVDNQADDVRGFVQAGFALVAGEWNDPDLMSKVADSVRELWPEENRSRRAAIGRQHIDGNGAKRLVAAVLSHWTEHDEHA
jgi:spore coat polysaccharide biosynthesis predicted glycosyltransferase SpsG